MVKFGCTLAKAAKSILIREEHNAALMQAESQAWESR
jgi:hypothetical protein